VRKKWRGGRFDWEKREQPSKCRSYTRNKKKRISVKILTAILPSTDVGYRKKDHHLGPRAQGNPTDESTDKQEYTGLYVQRGKKPEEFIPRGSMGKGYSVLTFKRALKKKNWLRKSYLGGRGRRTNTFR